MLQERIAAASAAAVPKNLPSNTSVGVTGCARIGSRLPRSRSPDMLIAPRSRPISGAISTTRLMRLATVRPKPATPKVPSPENPNVLNPSASPVNTTVNSRNHRLRRESWTSLLITIKILDSAVIVVHSLS